MGGDARHEGGLNVSAETSRRLRWVLEARDGGCAFPGCDVRHADGHHIKHWAEGGHTRLDNVALTCRRHRRAVHEGGWSVRLGDDDHAVFYRPDGRRLPNVPQNSAVPPEPAAALEAANDRLGVDPDARTATPDWCGESLDLGLAINRLWREKAADLYSRPSRSASLSS